MNKICQTQAECERGKANERKGEIYGKVSETRREKNLRKWGQCQIVPTDDKQD